MGQNMLTGVPSSSRVIYIILMPMLSEGFSSGVDLFQVFVGTTLGQASRCLIVCSSPRSHDVCLSSLYPRFSIGTLRRPDLVQRRFGLASLEPGGSDSLGLKESSCGVVWRNWWTRGSAIKAFNRIEEDMS